MEEDLPIGDEDLAALDALEERRLQLLERAHADMALVRARLDALDEIERRSAAMVAGQQFSPLRSAP